MVPRELSRLRLTLVAIAAGDVVVVAALASAYGTDGVLSTIAALVLAPVAVCLTWANASRLAGPRFADAAAAVYVGLPLLGTIYMLGTYRSTFTHQVVPDLIGLRATPWFALGLLLAASALTRWTAPAFLIAGGVWLVVRFGELGAIRTGLHETVWSIAMLEWLAIAGVLGAARRSWLRALGLGGWLAFGVAHATARGYADAAFWQSLSLTAPAIAVLLSSLWLLVPRLRSASASRAAH